MAAARCQPGNHFWTIYCQTLILPAEMDRICFSHYVHWVFFLRRMTQKVNKFKLLNNCEKHPPLMGYCLTYHITNTLNFKTCFVYRMTSLMISEVKSLKESEGQSWKCVVRTSGRKQHKGILFCIELVDIYSHPECCLSR